jgi:cytochrome c peroxidase
MYTKPIICIAAYLTITLASLGLLHAAEALTNKSSSWATRMSEAIAPFYNAHKIPLGLMRPSYPNPNGRPPSDRQVELGRLLFFDNRLSRDQTISCASCHQPEYGFSDPAVHSKGVEGQLGKRNSMSLLNVALFEEFSWDGHNTSLENQTLEALTNPAEMAMSHENIEAVVKEDYGEELIELYGDASTESVAKAISDFQRTLLSGSSPFDRYIYLGEEDAISVSAKRGLEIFLRQGRCIQCHMVRCDDCHPFGGTTGFFTNFRYHNVGVGLDNEKGKTGDLGRYLVTNDAANTASFKTPSLRNVALTAPYMHDGSLQTLEEVVEHYNKGGKKNSQLDPEIHPLNLNDHEKSDLVAFLNTLTSEEYLSSTNVGSAIKKAADDFAR